MTATVERPVISYQVMTIPTRGSRIFRDGSEGPEMVRIPKGSFLMGSREIDSEQPRHDVCVIRPFAIGRFPVTFEEYDRYCAAAGLRLPYDEGWGRGRRPVINVSWNSAVAYCGWLSQETGRHYRLPSEAEWEYACRAGAETLWSFGDDHKELGKHAWFKGNSGGKTHPVGEKQPNPWGIYDMHGNVHEWVQDHWYSDYRGAPNDGRARENVSGDSRVLRGGSCNLDPWFCRSARRDIDHSGNIFYTHGFRIARDL